MSRHFAALAVLAGLALVPSLAFARGYGRSGGYINTPFGQMNTRSPEYKMSGGNPLVYQEIMQQKMMMQQQQMMMKQQQKYMQQMQKLAKQQKNNPQPSTPISNVNSLSSKKKKKRTYTPTSTAASSKDKPTTTASADVDKSSKSQEKAQP